MKRSPLVALREVGGMFYIDNAMGTPLRQEDCPTYNNTRSQHVRGSLLSLLLSLLLLSLLLSLLLLSLLLLSLLLALLLLALLLASTVTVCFY